MSNNGYVRLDRRSLDGLLQLTARWLGAVAVLLLNSSDARAPAHADHSTPPGLPEVMRRANDAAGYGKFEKARAGLRLTGSATRYGVDADYSLAFFPDGRFVERTGGALGETYGWDGRSAWTVDHNGMPGPLELEDRETELTALWVETGRWCSARSPFVIALSGQRAGADTDGRIALSIRLRGGLLQARLLLDSATALPIELRYTVSGGEEVWTYSDYRSESGLTFAHGWRHTAAGLEDCCRLDAASQSLSDRTMFRQPASKPDDTRFDPGASGEVPTNHSPSGHVFVHPLVNGKDVGWFFLDTGAGEMCITPEAADAAGMPAIGAVSENGVGGNVKARFRASQRVELGPVTISGLKFVELDLKFLAPAFPFKIGGVVGCDLFERAVVCLQPTTGRVEVHDPKQYDPAQVRWQALHLEGRNAATECSFDHGGKALFKLDTGAGNDTVTFHAPAVRRYHLLDGRQTKDSGSGGVGGTVAAKSGTIDWFEIGGHRFEKPKVSFSLADQGAFTDAYVAGNLGQGFLKPFTMIFDYPRRRVGFQAPGAAKAANDTPAHPG